MTKFEDFPALWPDGISKRPMRTATKWLCWNHRSTIDQPCSELWNYLNFRWGPGLRRNFLNSNVAPKMSLQKTHLNFISARSSEDPILLGKIQGAFAWKNTSNPPGPTILLRKKQGTHQATILLGKHKEPTRSPPFYLEPTRLIILLGKTPGAHHFPWKNTRNPPGAHHFTWKNTRNPPGAHHFTWKNTRNPPGAHHFTWKNTRNPPGAHHFTWKNTRNPTVHPLGNIINIEKWQRWEKKMTLFATINIILQRLA